MILAVPPYMRWGNPPELPRKLMSKAERTEHIFSRWGEVMRRLVDGPEPASSILADSTDLAWRDHLADTIAEQDLMDMDPQQVDECADAVARMNLSGIGEGDRITPPNDNKALAKLLQLGERRPSLDHLLDD